MLAWHIIDAQCTMVGWMNLSTLFSTRRNNLLSVESLLINFSLARGQCEGWKNWWGGQIRKRLVIIYRIQIFSVYIFNIFLSLSLVCFCLHSVPGGQRGLALVMRVDAENYKAGKCVEWGALTRVPPSPQSFLVLAEDLCIGVMLVVGGRSGGVEPFTFFL